MPEAPPSALFAAPDQAARDAISARTDATLFVDAGAGSGKTTKLVDRVLAVIDGTPDSPGVPLSAIAAITFTEKAGAELRERLRRELERTVAASPGGPVAAARRAALDDLDGAAIGTLHSFAQRILGEHPVEAGLPPRVEITDEISSGVAFERRWRRWSDELFDDPRYARTLLLLSAADVSDATPAALARTFNANWDLVERHVAADAAEPPVLGARLEIVLARIDAVCDLAEHCIDPADKLVAHLGTLREWAVAARAADDEPAALEALMSLKARSRVGRKQSWRIEVDDVRAELDALDAAVAELRAEVIDACAHHLGSAIREFTLASAEARRRSGSLEFHDLLVLARHLLTHPDHGAAARTTLGQRYQRLLLDEFQDTDPIQVELAVRITSAEPARDDGDGGGAPDWRDVAVAPGRLFVVGDPKQSIYRFRRADIGVYLRAKAALAGDGDRAVSLHANFRTVPGIVEVVNRTFSVLMAEEPADELFPAEHEATRPEYAPLTAVRPSGPPDGGPAVAVVGRTPHPYKTSAATVREAEAADVAATATRAVGEGWSVQDRDGTWRPARLGDITILVPARTSLPYLEQALDDAGIAYRAEASSLVYATRAVRDLVLVARAVADPTDELRVVSALRTPLFGCGDDDLFRYRVERRASWSYLAPRPDTVPADDPVAEGLAALARWHRGSVWASPSTLLETIVRERRAFELAFADGRPRDTWRRLRFVVDQARAWTEATSGDLRGYLEWVDQQTAEGARVAESVLPETDDDAVRIMTIHAAKGLEFPVTIVSGMSSYPQSGHRAGDARFTTDGVAYNLGRKATTTAYEAGKPLDEQMDLDERIRLLYVATTRARDHLVVSLHRVERKTAPARSKRTNAELLIAGAGDGLDDLPDAVEAAPIDAVVVQAPVPPAPLQPFADWQAEHRAALLAGARRTTVAATALTPDAAHDPALDVAEAAEPVESEAEAETEAEGEPDADTGAQLTLALDAPPDRSIEQSPDGSDGGLRKRPRDLDRPPWLKGRYGTAVGRAVHGVLQTVPLDAAPDGSEVTSAVAAQAQAEAVPERADVVAGLVADALRSPSVRAAAEAPHWREVFVGTPVEAADGRDRLLEGYVDLLYRGPEGLVVVDYKTAATADPDEISRRVDGYRLQGGAYALAVGRTTGEPVVAVVFCFLTPVGVVERTLADLDGAVAAVMAQVATDAEVELV